MTEQTQPRVRTRAPIQATAAPPPAAPAAAPAAAGRAPAGGPPDDTWMYRGAHAEQARAREVARQEQRRSQGFRPFRYWLPVGAQGDLIILDNQTGPCFYEHALPDPNNANRRTLFELCPKEYDSCPLCAAHGESYYVMFMSVIDMRPFNKRDGTPVQWSRKLIAVKTQQHPFFVRLQERNPNLRGVHLLMSRDSQQSFAIGNPEFVQCHDEQMLVDSFSHERVVGQDGRVLKEANADMFPYEYGRIFARPTGDDLRARYGGVAPAGSSADTRDQWGGNAPAAAPPAAAPPTGVQPVATSVPAAEGTVEPEAAVSPAAAIDLQRRAAATESAPAAAPSAAPAEAPASAPAAASGGIQTTARPDQPRPPAGAAPAGASPAVAPAAGSAAAPSADPDDEIPF